MIKSFGVAFVSIWPNSTPPFLNFILAPSASRTISPPTSSVKSPLSEIVEPFIVISSTVSVVSVPTLVIFGWAAVVTVPAVVAVAAFPVVSWLSVPITKSNVLSESS